MKVKAAEKDALVQIREKLGDAEELADLEEEGLDEELKEEVEEEKEDVVGEHFTVEAQDAISTLITDGSNTTVLVSRKGEIANSG